MYHKILFLCPRGVENFYIASLIENKKTAQEMAEKLFLFGIKFMRLAFLLQQELRRQLPSLLLLLAPLLERLRQELRR